VSSSGKPDYSGVTETPGTLVGRDAASMAVSRYEIVRRLASGKRVLEVACGSGQGLGYVAGTASWMVGGDITHDLLLFAQGHYKGSIPLVEFDAHAMPFRDGSFDIVQIHEAVYYMARPGSVFKECQRVLRAEGVLVVSSINPSWPDFNPSPHAIAYLDCQEMKAVLSEIFNSAEILFGFAVASKSATSALVSAIKRLAVRFNMIPKTMRGKTILKRLFLGPLVAVPAEITEGMAQFETPCHADPNDASRFRIIYVIARL
jgi:ubiquinone/menaquinone biosynthesis C-methylase UbiE